VKTKVAALAFFALLTSTMIYSSRASPGTWLIYDNDDRDIAHGNGDTLAVLFTPPTYPFVNLFEVKTINVSIAYDEWDCAGFDIYVTDENHNSIKAFPNQQPSSTLYGWYSMDVSGQGVYVDSDFYVEFHPLFEPQKLYAAPWIDEVEGDEFYYNRSYCYTYGPPDAILDWYPIELIYPYGISDVMIRVELEPETPQSLLLDLRETVLNADDSWFRGYIVTNTKQLKNALANKMDAVINMFEMGNFQGGYKKLDKDITPKLNFCGTVRVRALSWLSLDPELEDVVYEFAGMCQELIGIIKLADPRPTP